MKFYDVIIETQSCGNKVAKRKYKMFGKIWETKISPPTDLISEREIIKAIKYFGFTH